MKNLDLMILGELRKDGRISNIELAKKLDVSEGSIRNHISALLAGGIIKKFTIDIALKTDFRTITLLTTKSKVASKSVVTKLLKLKGIEKIFEVSGDFDIVIETRTQSPSDYNGLIEKIRGFKEIGSTESLVVFEAH